MYDRISGTETKELKTFKVCFFFFGFVFCYSIVSVDTLKMRTENVGTQRTGLQRDVYLFMEFRFWHFA